MANDWIKWVKGLASRREVCVLASMLNRDPHEVAGRLMVLWEWCDSNMSDADVESEVSSDVSLILGDKAAAFVDALLGLPGMAEAMTSPGVKWLELRSGGRIVFPNLARHNGTSAKTRAYEARRKAEQRSVRREKCPKSVPVKTGLEKRREDLIPPKPPKGGGRSRLSRAEKRDAESDVVLESLKIKNGEVPHA